MNYFNRYSMHQTDSIVKHSFNYGGITLNQKYFLVQANTNTDGIFSKLDVVEVVFPKVTYKFCKITKTGKVSSSEKHFLSHHRLFDTRQEALTYAEALKQFCISSLKKGIEWRQHSLENMKLINP